MIGDIDFSALLRRRTHEGGGGEIREQRTPKHGLYNHTARIYGFEVEALNEIIVR